MLPLVFSTDLKFNLFWALIYDFLALLLDFRFFLFLGIDPIFMIFFSFWHIITTFKIHILLHWCFKKKHKWIYKKSLKACIMVLTATATLPRRIKLSFFYLFLTVVFNLSSIRKSFPVLIGLIGLLWRNMWAYILILVNSWWLSWI